MCCGVAHREYAEGEEKKEGHKYIKRYLCNYDTEDEYIDEEDPDYEFKFSCLRPTHATQLLASAAAIFTAASFMA